MSKPDPHAPEEAAAGPAGLEPCPFCGGQSLAYEDAIPEVCDEYVQCNACNAMIQDVGARAAWNRRPPPASETALVEALERTTDAFERLLRAWMYAPFPRKDQIAGSMSPPGGPLAAATDAIVIARTALAAHRAQQEGRG